MKKPILLNDERTLSAGRTVVKFSDYMEVRRAELEARHRAEAEALQEEYRVGSLKAWADLHATAGLPVGEVGEWAIETRFADLVGLILVHHGQCSCGMDHGTEAAQIVGARKH